MDVSTRLNDSNDLLSTSVGTDNSAETSKKTSSSTKETSSRSKRKNSRSKSPRSRRHRSKSRSFSPSSRRQRDPRLRGRRSRSTNRGPRSPPRGRKSGSRERYRGNRRNWSPRKKGPVSPPPIQPVNHGFNMPPPQMYTDGYNYPQSYAPPAPAYGTYDYSMQSQPPFAYPTQPVLQPVPPGDDFQQPNWVHAPHMTLPPPALIVPPPIQVSVETEEEKLKREAAVAKEKKTQRATLGKQREDYRRRAAALKRELNTLKEQRDDLISGSEPPSPTTKGFIKENDRLQLQIENKITSIENVIDMLTNIIGTNTSPTPSPPPPPSSAKSKKDKEKKKKADSFSDDDSSPERLKNKALESLKKKKGGNDVKVAELKNDDDVNDVPVDDKYKSAQKINYVHYDPQMHWCKQCNIFPKTAKDFLIHLHSKEHQDSQKIVEPPWHDKPINDEMPQYPNAPTKRTPIRGLQFFVPTTGWYCTICSIWMGDLHCASLHLKSQTHANNYNDYNNLNPHFEVDWVSERHKAYEDQREKNPTAVADRPQQPAPVAPVPMPVPPPALTIEQEVMEGIPLQLQIPATHKIDLDDGKKKKKKKKSEEKKDKKKKKRSKKRRQSSSSSSSSDSSESDANVVVEKNREDTSHSIRVAMRNLLKQQNEKKVEESGGKWTVVQQAQQSEPAPPPPTISTNGENDNRRDDLMISQWNVPEPIITADEKKLLEQLKGQLKGRMKANSKEREVNGRKRSKEHSKERSREPRERNESRVNERERDRDRNRRRRSRSRRSRSRSRERRRRSRSRSRGRFRSRSRSPGRWNRRWSRSRSRSRSRSGRVEKPIVRYPEFRPRVPEKESEKVDKKKISKKEQDEQKNSNSSKTESKKTVIVLKNQSTNKKLPFIGRMPVFKRQTNEEEVKKAEAAAESIGNENYHSYYDSNVQHMSMEDYDDLMPDPMQFVSLMGAAPPPPPRIPPSTVDKNEPVLPPGIDEADADLVRKTISDAPLPRKGPLPQDFQDALSIIFDQKSIQETETEKAVQPEPTIKSDAPTVPIQIVNEHSQHATELYQASTFPLPAIQRPEPDLSFAEDVDIPDPLPLPIPPPPPPPPVKEEVEKEKKLDEEDPSVAAKKNEDSALMDDLAMLGIDADDLAAQCI